ncbi:hypothetical protein BX600DRAFT_521487 [Xylariales sp. PMI_506]|nr:hypothetical protein BX600DRAFT_521487 [Xylariales sp. PMI_506]
MAGADRTNMSNFVEHRRVSRRMLRGSFKQLQFDDYLILFAMITHTVAEVSLSLVATMAIDDVDLDSVDVFDSESVSALDPKQLKDLVLFCKLAMVAEQTQIITLWAVKICLILQYSRLTSGSPIFLFMIFPSVQVRNTNSFSRFVLNSHFFVKAVGVYVVLTFVVMEILFYAAWCTPISAYWVFPMSNGLFIVFSLGIFTIIAAVLSKYYTLTNAGNNVWMAWYIRESSTAIIVASLPCALTLVRRVYHRVLRIESGDSTAGIISDHQSRPHESGETCKERRCQHTGSRQHDPMKDTMLETGDARRVETMPGGLEEVEGTARLQRVIVAKDTT